MLQEEKRLSIIQDFYRFKDKQIEFFDLALEVFQYQNTHNVVYKSYLEAIHFDSKPEIISDFAFLPIQFFKTHKVKTGEWNEEIVFNSSGTGGIQSKHFIRDLQFYLDNTANIFTSEIGEISKYCILGLLPGYLDRKGSSLIEMVKHFIDLSEHQESGFYLDEYDKLLETIKRVKIKNKPIILFGVSFALLEFLETHKPNLSDITIIETGGMKGTGVEITKLEIYNKIKKNSNDANVSSEYGMTELLSQAYAKDCLYFDLPDTMAVLISQINDPFSECKNGKAGQINIIDLANIDTCAFIQTQDMGRLNDKGQLEILGRIDEAEMRGCNLLLEEIY